jgi:hypothetical protein
MKRWIYTNKVCRFVFHLISSALSRGVYWTWGDLHSYTDDPRVWYIVVRYKCVLFDIYPNINKYQFQLEFKKYLLYSLDSLFSKLWRELVICKWASSKLNKVSNFFLINLKLVIFNSQKHNTIHKHVLSKLP